MDLDHRHLLDRFKKQKQKQKTAASLYIILSCPSFSSSFSIPTLVNNTRIPHARKRKNKNTKRNPDTDPHIFFIHVTDKRYLSIWNHGNTIYQAMYFVV